MTASAPASSPSSPSSSPAERLRAAVARAARDGLQRPRGEKKLPPWLFYDDEGSRLFERITELPAYYLTRAERSIFVAHADDIVAAAAAGTTLPLKVVEFGAGTATKSQIILSAVVRRQGHCLFVPIDVSAAALGDARDRLALQEPLVEVRPLAVQHEEAIDDVAALGPRRLLLFIGSSIGNFDDDAAVALLTTMRRSVAAGGALLLGADRAKSPALLIPAYDDDEGVTAAFNRRALHRLNDVVGADFDVDRFVHRAIWNAKRSRIEMHLESRGAQRVVVDGFVVDFTDGETIHTESSHKYTDEKVRSLLERSGFRLERTWQDDDALFGVHLARA